MPPLDGTAFAAALQAECAAVGAFIDLLEKEQEILVRGDADQLARLGPDKAALIDRLTRLGTVRERHLAEHRLDLGSNGIETFLNGPSGPGPSVCAGWRQLLASAEIAHQINVNNGRMIDTRLQRNRLQLTVLQTAAAGDGVYHADGQLRPLYRARPLSQV